MRDSNPRECGLEWGRREDGGMLEPSGRKRQIKHARERTGGTGWGGSEYDLRTCMLLPCDMPLHISARLVLMFMFHLIQVALSQKAVVLHDIILIYFTCFTPHFFVDCVRRCLSMWK